MGLFSAGIQPAFQLSKPEPLNSKRIDVGLLEPGVQLFVNTSKPTAFVGCSAGSRLDPYEVIQETLRDQSWL